MNAIKRRKFYLHNYIPAPSIKNKVNVQTDVKTGNTG